MTTPVSASTIKFTLADLVQSGIIQSQVMLRLNPEGDVLQILSYKGTQVAEQFVEPEESDPEHAMYVDLCGDEGSHKQLVAVFYVVQNRRPDVWPEIKYGEISIPLTKATLAIEFTCPPLHYRALGDAK